MEQQSSNNQPIEEWIEVDGEWHRLTVVCCSRDFTPFSVCTRDKDDVCHVWDIHYGGGGGIRRDYHCSAIGGEEYIEGGWAVWLSPECQHLRHQVPQRRFIKTLPVGYNPFRQNSVI